jgi:FdhD protein
VHACAVFKNHGDHAELLHFVEDVGRHNAVDSIAGLMWLEDQPGDNLIFYTTGRLTSEMVIKGAQMGIPFLLSRSGVTAMGLEMANKLNLTLFGRCSGQHYLIYSGVNRFVGKAADVHTA